MQWVNAEFGFIGPDGTIRFTVPRKQRRRIAWRMSKNERRRLR
jgi:hypothetical protein